MTVGFYFRRLGGGLARAAAIMMGLAGGAHAAGGVVWDGYRGIEFYPGAPLPAPRYDNTGNTDATLNGLIGFATQANRISSGSSDTIDFLPSARFLCQNGGMLESFDGVTYFGDANTQSCQEGRMGAALYSALLLPKAGDYTITLSNNDRVQVATATAPPPNLDFRGAAFTELGRGNYVDSPSAFRKLRQNAGDPPGDELPGIVHADSDNSLVLVRLIWNNWGNASFLRMRWQKPDGSAAEIVPAGNLLDPGAQATYVDAVDDGPLEYDAATGTTTTLSVLANDAANGASNPAPGTVVTLTTPVAWPAGITLNADGTIAIAAGTAQPAGPLTYRICRASAPMPMCDDAQVTLTRREPPVAGSVSAVPTLQWPLLAALGLMLAAAMGMRWRR